MTSTEGPAPGPAQPADGPDPRADQPAQPPDGSVEAAMTQAKQPTTILAGPYGHPLHPALVALPIGAWVASVCFDIVSHLVAEPAAFAQGARWLIAIGVLGAIAAAMVGFLDLLGLPPGTRVFRVGLLHLTFALIGTAGFAVGFALRDAEPTGPVPAGLLALSVAALLLIGGAGYLGGDLAYRYGVRVADRATQAEGYQRPSTSDTEE